MENTTKTNRIDEMSTKLLKKLYRIALDRHADEMIQAIERELEERRKAQRAKYKAKADEEFFNSVLATFQK